VKYQSWRGASQRELEPLGLVLKAGAWYLAAREAGHEDMRTYRLASVQGLVVGTRAVKRPRGFDLARWWRESSARFESGLRRLQARVRLTQRGMGWLANARVPYVAVPGAEPGEVLLAIESIEHGARQLLAFGAEVEVIEPPALRNEVLRQARALLTRHAPAARSAARR
jgi:predicted DNA-binding transcriptional regulator YafY